MLLPPPHRQEIQLTRGKKAIVDIEDFDYLNQWKWSCNYYGYAIRSEGGRKNKKCIFMHRLINKTPKGFDTDHINRNTLDNRKENLRTATRSQNEINKGLRKDNKTGFKGIRYVVKIKRWTAYIGINKKFKHLGCFKTKKEAIECRKVGEKLYFKY